MDVNKFIGNKIREFRLKKNITQEELAELLQTTPQSISRYEIGERKTNNDILFQLADYFKISINDFFPPITQEQVKQEIDDDMTEVYNEDDMQVFIKGKPTKEKMQKALDNMYDLKKEL